MPTHTCQVVEQSFLAMGTMVSVKIVAGNAERQGEAAAEICRLQQAMKDFGRHWWAWGNGSLAGINREITAGCVVQIPVAMQALFARAWQLHLTTGGLFEPRIAELVRLWGFDDVARLRVAPPAQADVNILLEAIKAAPPYIDGHAYGPAPGVAWDFGAIGKGYIVDVVLDALRACGFMDAMIDAGGNLATRGTRGDRAWHVGIRDPRSDADQPRLLASFDTQDESVVTHGNDQRFFDYKGRRYAHILDPATGVPVQGLRSLTVVHVDGTLADAGGAALFVAGSGWRELAARLGIDQVILVTDKDVVLATERLAERLRPQPGVRVEIVP